MGSGAESVGIMNYREELKQKYEGIKTELTLHNFTGNDSSRVMQMVNDCLYFQSRIRAEEEADKIRRRNLQIKELKKRIDTVEKSAYDGEHHKDNLIEAFTFESPEHMKLWNDFSHSYNGDEPPDQEEQGDVCVKCGASLVGTKESHFECGECRNR